MLKHIGGYLIPALLIGLAVEVIAQNKPQDIYGHPDQILVQIAPQNDKWGWVVGVYLENDEDLAAVTVPLKFGDHPGQYKLDSVSFVGTRVTYFALKAINSYDTLNSVLIGLLASLGDNNPPLASGSGPVALVYLTQTERLDSIPDPPRIDSTFFPPYNTLELVTPSAQPIKPTFKVKIVKKLSGFDDADAKKAKGSRGKKR